MTAMWRMHWAQRLKREFGIETDRSARCSGRLKVLASMEDPAVTARILAHLQRASGASYVAQAMEAVAASRDGGRR